MTWRSANGGKTIEIKKDGEAAGVEQRHEGSCTLKRPLDHTLSRPFLADMEGLYWTKNSRVCQLGVRVKDGPTTNFLGFRDKVRC
jgi:structure-specific recognition protein 1